MIWRSWVRTPVESNLGYIVLLPQVVLELNRTIDLSKESSQNCTLKKLVQIVQRTAHFCLKSYHCISFMLQPWFGGPAHYRKPGTVPTSTRHSVLWCGLREECQGNKLLEEQVQATKSSHLKVTRQTCHIIWGCILPSSQEGSFRCISFKNGLPRVGLRNSGSGIYLGDLLVERKSLMFHFQIVCMCDDDHSFYITEYDTFKQTATLLTTDWDWFDNETSMQWCAYA